MGRKFCDCSVTNFAIVSVCLFLTEYINVKNPLSNTVKDELKKDVFETCVEAFRS